MYRVIGLVVVVFFVVLSVLLLAGCPPEVNTPGQVFPTSATRVKMVDYQNGVYYFNTETQSLSNELSEFLSAHQDLEVSAMAPNPATLGGAYGFYVTFRPKCRCCCHSSPSNPPTKAEK